jgi:O-antigen ligase
MVTKIEHINKYIFILFPITFVTGPLIPELLALFLIFSFLIFKKSALKIQNFEFFEIKWFIVFSLLILILSFFSLDYYLSFKNSLFYFRFILLFVFFKIILEENKNLLFIFHKFLILFILFLCADLLFQFINGKNFFGMETKYYNGARFSGLFGDEYIIGSYLMKLLPILNFLYLFLSEKKNYKITLINIILLTLIYLSILISGERTSIMHLIIYIFSISLLSKKILKINFIPIFALILVIFFLFLNNNNLIKRNVFFLTDQIYSFVVNVKNFSNTENETIKNSNKNQGTVNLSIYNWLFNSAYIGFKEKPIIGYGPNTFRKFCQTHKINYKEQIKRCSNHPHNYYLQLLSETGMVGFFIFLIFYLNFLKVIIFHIFKKNKIMEHTIPLIIGILIFFIPFSTSGNFFNNWITYLSFYPIVFIIYLKSNNKFFNND